MENIIATLTEREYTVTVSSEEFTPSWIFYTVDIRNRHGSITVGQFDLMPLARKLYQALEVIQKEEDRIEAAEAFPVEA